jgi:hypothetical protein
MQLGQLGRVFLVQHMLFTTGYLGRGDHAEWLGLVGG